MFGSVFFTVFSGQSQRHFTSDRGYFYYSGQAPSCTAMTRGGVTRSWNSQNSNSSGSNPFVYLLAVTQRGRVSFSEQLLGPLQPACLPKEQHCEAPLRATSQFFHCSFTLFSSPFSSLLLLSHSHIVPSQLPRRDICCCLRGTPPGSEPRRHPVLVATSLVLRTPLDYSSTSVYRPIGVLVCEPPKGQVAPMSNMAPFYL